MDTSKASSRLCKAFLQAQLSFFFKKNSNLNQKYYLASFKYLTFIESLARAF